MKNIVTLFDMAKRENFETVLIGGYHKDNQDVLYKIKNIRNPHRWLSTKEYALTKSGNFGMNLRRRERILAVTIIRFWDNGQLKNLLIMKLHGDFDRYLCWKFNDLGIFFRQWAKWLDCVVTVQGEAIETFIDEYPYQLHKKATYFQSTPYTLGHYEFDLRVNTPLT